QPPARRVLAPQAAHVSEPTAKKHISAHLSNFTNLRDETSLDNRSTPPLAVLVNQSGKTHEITRKTP
ncbi:hypothetical protein ABNY90_26190, partial [Escherichia coli]|uniref:hypothetical protein n=3 Tax=Escherichia TaxID=561 RepID=UPI0032DA8993